MTIPSKQVFDNLVASGAVDAILRTNPELTQTVSDAKTSILLEAQWNTIDVASLGTLSATELDSRIDSLAKVRLFVNCLQYVHLLPYCFNNV
jgi:hypothetical protein